MASSRSEGSWCLIESDPGVFTEIIKGFGVSGVECEEVIDLDYLSHLSQPFGMIFLYKWQEDDTNSKNIVKNEEGLNQIFFAKQVITNACATQALLNILFNLDNIKLGSVLSELKDFCGSFDAHMKGLTISNSDEIRKVHNSFSCNTLFELEDKRSNSTEDTYHFIGYMPIQGHLYELDGLQDGPIDLGAVSESGSWVETVKPVIMERMKRHSGTHFNIMALVPDRLQELEKQLQQLQATGDPEEQMPQILNNLQEERSKHEQYRIENIRRRHNYMPFIIELMKILAEEGKLTPLIEKAEEIAINRRKRKLESSRNKMEVVE